MTPFWKLLIVFIVTFIASNTLAATGATRAERTETIPAKKAIIGYVFPRKDVLPDETLRGDLLTHVNFAFANIKNGQIVAERPNDDANLKTLTGLRKSFPDLRILVSVGGWSWSGGFSDMALTKKSRGKFIRSAVEFLQKQDLDGIDLDWEYPGLPGAGNTHRPADRKNFTSLLSELRMSLNAAQKQAGKKYLLTIAAGASRSFLQHTEMKKASRSLDYVNLMTYDFLVESGGRSGHHSNLYASSFNPGALSAAASVKAFLRAGVPAKKLVLGVPFYGRGWKDAPATNNGLYQKAAAGEGGLSWSNLIQSFIDKNGYVRWWDSEAKAPYLWKADEGRVVTYDDPESLTEKCRYIMKNNLGGVMFWEYTADDAEHTLLRTLRENLHDQPVQRPDKP